MSQLNVPNMRIIDLEFPWAKSIELSSAEGEYFSISLDDSSYSSWSTVKNYTYNFSTQGTHSITVKVARDNIGTDASDGYKIEFNTRKLVAPLYLDFTKNGVNSGILTWKSNYVNNENFVANVYDNNTLLGTTLEDRFSVSNCAQGDHSFSVQYTCNYSSYNSDVSTKFFRFKKLTAPKVTIENIATDNIVNKVRFKVNTNEAFSGISFRLVNETYNNNSIEHYNDDTIEQDSEHPDYIVKDVEINDNTNYYRASGNHKVYAQLLFTDSDYNSTISTELSYTISTLEAPVTVWENNVAELSWYPVANADYYEVSAELDNESLGNTVVINQVLNNEEKNYLWVIDPDPNTGSVNGLILNIPNQTSNISINTIAKSFKPWYFNSSSTSTSTYSVIKLNTPTNLDWDEDTFTLSWNSVSDANLYTIYDSGKKILDTTNTSYQLDNLQRGLHLLTVTASKKTTTT